MSDLRPAKVLFFSVFRDLVGSDSLEWEVPKDGIRLEELIESLHEAYPRLAGWQGKTLLAVNCEYANRDVLVSPGDEVAIMPPVQGG